MPGLDEFARPIPEGEQVRVGEQEGPSSILQRHISERARRFRRGW
jgi:hypothetical protein